YRIPPPEDRGSVTPRPSLEWAGRPRSRRNVARDLERSKPTPRRERHSDGGGRARDHDGPRFSSPPCPNVAVANSRESSGSARESPATRRSDPRRGGPRGVASLPARDARPPAAPFPAP